MTSCHSAVSGVLGSHMTTVENFGMIYSTTPSGLDVNDFAGPNKAPMYVNGLLIDIFLDSTIEKLRYLIGVRFIE